MKLSVASAMNYSDVIAVLLAADTDDMGFIAQCWLDELQEGEPAEYLAFTSILRAA